MRKPIITAVILFILLIALVTFPLLFKLNSVMPAFFSTDESFTSLWDSWRIQHSFFNGLSFKNTGYIVYPFGHEIYGSGYVSYLWMALFYVLSIISNPLMTYNFQIIMNLFLTAVFTFLFVFYLTRNHLGAFLSGVIFAFCPYQFARVWQHLGLTYNQWIPLCLFAAVLLREKPSRKNTFLLGVSFLLLYSFDFVIMYLASITLAVFFCYIAYKDLRLKKTGKNKGVTKDTWVYLKRVVSTGCVILVVLLPQFLPVIKNRFVASTETSASAFSGARRPFDDLFSQSARPLSYFLPASVHPVFGEFTEKFVGSSLYGDSFTEHALYLGFLPILLAWLAIRRWRGSRKESVSADGRDNFYIGYFVLLAIAAWLFSQPPWWRWGPVKIYMPSFFMYKILPVYRAYCRFGIVLMLAVAVLAGYGLKFFMERFRSAKARIIIAVIACGVVLFEFWNWPPYKVIDVSRVPAVYYWLKSEPADTVIAEYPLDANGPNDFYKLYQIKHGKKMINSTVPGTSPNKIAKTITRLSELRTAGVLKWLGVKYVLVHRLDYAGMELVEELEDFDKIPQNPGLKLIKTFPAQSCPDVNIRCIEKTGPVDVYEVIAEPIEPVEGGY